MNRDLPRGETSDHPRRPFKARGSAVVRCEGCRLPQLNCLCPYKVKVEARARFWLITHALERHKPTNTGRLIADCLASTEVFGWSRTEPDPLLLERLADPRFMPFLVFPDDQPDYADRVVAYRAPDDERIPVFVILDGTWRQARRMFRQSPYLARLPIVALRTDRLTRYRLRTPASAQHLCTAEVAAELLRVAGELEAAGVLDDYFDVFNESYAASRAYRRLERPSAAMRRQLERLEAPRDGLGVSTAPAAG
ncbi:tRNA-uridine aminocarboxypropyltransferase [Halotalea alkalilenta]|uniref:tRNA-uridine aminocarboxypropyltransferase n=1 Tax=Halotalea alkalilenta TaxID=376489 RepID=A0A172YIK6_9GAMM|nr:DTW domain-containing protein [Halotalea alkalilenta]ANF59060.1 DTW domain-containing protein [Halotalea alkalilenta]